MKRTVEMMRIAMTKLVKKGLGSITRYCNTLAPSTLLETQGVPLGNVRDFIKLDQTRQLQVAARQDNTMEKTTGLRKFKAQKQSLTQLGKEALINQKQDEIMEMDLEMDDIKISVSVPKHLSQGARKLFDTMRIAVEEIKKLDKQLEPSGKKSKERTHQPKSKELEPSGKKSMERISEPKSKEIAHASRKRKIGCFEALREATQYLDYNDYLRKNSDYIKYNSSPEQMLETLREDLTAKFPLLSENLLRYGMRQSIKALEGAHNAELAEKFSIFLLSCKFIEHDMETLHADEELIKQLEEFQREFSELPCVYISEGLYIYKTHLESRCDINENEWRSKYEDYVRNLYGRTKRGLLQLSSPFIDPLSTMVCRTYVAVEQMWIDCGLDLVAIKEEIRKTCSHLSEESYLDSTSISPREELLAKGSVQEALNLLSLKVNRTFLNCLIRQNFPLPDSGEDSLRSWFVDYLVSLLSQLPPARRYLAAQLDSEIGPRSKSGVVPQNSLDNSTVIIAVALTAAVTSITVVLLFLCFFKCQRRTHYPGYSLKDDKPLLSMSISDFSAGSSQKSLGTSNSLLAPPKPLKNDPSQKMEVSSSDSSSCFGNSKSLFAPPKPLKTDPSQKNVHVSSTDSSVETPASDVLAENSSSASNVLPENSNSLSDVLPGNSNSSSGVIPENSSSVSDVLPENSTSTKPKPSNIPTETPVLKSPAPPPQKPAASAPSPPGPPPPPRGGGPRPPPPPKGAAPQPPNAKLNVAKPNKAPPVPKRPGEEEAFDDGSAPKTKLKPFFWDKVQARNNQSMVWDRLKAGSFQFNEEMIESLFGCSDKNPAGNKLVLNRDASAQYVRILEPKKSQNLAISLKAMNVKSEEFCEALMEGNELPPELLHTLLKMAPTTEEELKIRLYGEPSKLGPAEQFIRNIVEVPFAYERIEALLFMVCLQEEATSTFESFSTIEVACKELRSSRLFFKLLEAVLKTGNRMNDGTYRGGAQAFKLDTLLKLADVRGTDGKTTLLNFVILEIIRAEGMRAARTLRESQSSFSSIASDDFFDDNPIESGDNYRDLGLKVVSGLSGELENVRKAAGMDADGLAHTVASLGERLLKMRTFLKTKMENCDEESQFLQSLRCFIVHAEADITSLVEAEKKMRSLVKETTDYFHGNSGKDEGLRLFVIVKEFLGMIDKVCKEVKLLPRPSSKTQRAKETPATPSPAMSPARDPPAMSPARDPRQLLFPAIKDRRVDFSDFSSSDDDD